MHCKKCNVRRPDRGGQAARPALDHLQNRPHLLVLGLARGGVPVARAVADLLGAPMDVYVVRKLGVPWQPELALGAVAESGALVWDCGLAGAFGIDSGTFEALKRKAKAEIAERQAKYRGGRAGAAVRGKTAIVVDDGIATGATMQAAIRALRGEGAERVIAAAPVGSASALAMLEREADEVVCLEVHEPFYSVGHWYQGFRQVSDAEVKQCLPG